jgi:4-hydroxybenzoate polyprenyltransferase
MAHSIVEKRALVDDGQVLLCGGRVEGRAGAASTTSDSKGTNASMHDFIAATRDIASILRMHIIAIAMTAALVFGWTLTDEYAWVAMVLGGLDWLLINLLNRVTDLKEDLLNGIRGTERIARRPNLALGLWLATQAGSLALGLWLAPELTPWRIAVQLVGVGYSYRVVPTPRGFKRFKDLYFFKNFMSAMLFVATVFVYPVAMHGLTGAGGPVPEMVANPDPSFWAPARVLVDWGTFALLVLFFVPFEITYEILYDMRDLDGDRAAAVPTYPVVHGLETSARIINSLLLMSSLVLIAGFVTEAIGARELLMVVAPGIQYLFYRKRFRRGLTTGECIGVTWLGAALLLFWLLGTRLWIDAGLPKNLWWSDIF